MSNVLCCSQNELWTHAVHPEHPPWKVGVVSADEVNHWFSWLEAVGAMQELCVYMKGVQEFKVWKSGKSCVNT